MNTSSRSWSIFILKIIIDLPDSDLRDTIRWFQKRAHAQYLKMYDFIIGTFEPLGTSYLFSKYIYINCLQIWSWLVEVTEREYYTILKLICDFVRCCDGMQSNCYCNSENGNFRSASIHKLLMASSCGSSQHLFIPELTSENYEHWMHDCHPCNAKLSIIQKWYYWNDITEMILLRFHSLDF